LIGKRADGRFQHSASVPSFPAASDSTALRCQELSTITVHRPTKPRRSHPVTIAVLQPCSPPRLRRAVPPPVRPTGREPPKRSRLVSLLRWMASARLPAAGITVQARPPPPWRWLAAMAVASGRARPRKPRLAQQATPGPVTTSWHERETKPQGPAPAGLPSDSARWQVKPFPQKKTEFCLFN
jgi:hypothetical protein